MKISCFWPFAEVLTNWTVASVERCAKTLAMWSLGPSKVKTCMLLWSHVFVLRSRSGFLDWKEVFGTNSQGFGWTDSVGGWLGRSGRLFRAL